MHQQVAMVHSNKRAPIDTKAASHPGSAAARPAERDADKKTEMAVKLSALKTQSQRGQEVSHTTHVQTPNPGAPPPNAALPNGHSAADAAHMAGRQERSGGGARRASEMPREVAKMLSEQAFRPKTREGKPPMTVAQHREAVRAANEAAATTPTARSASARHAIMLMGDK